MSGSRAYLCGSRDFHVDSLTVINAGSPVTTGAFAYLHDSIAIDAVHNSEERYDAPKCHPETRKAVQEEILSWITHGDACAQPTKILWLTGPAGAGKTAIVGSVADTCDERGILAGSFFFASFTGSEDRRSKRRFVATLVYHLILPLDDEHPLRKAILSAVQRDPSIFRRRLKDQLRILLVKPLHDTLGRFSPEDLPRAFFIDGLDEVEAADSRQPGRDQSKARSENEKDQEDILSALLYAAEAPSFPFLFIIASRPERAIESFLTSRAGHLTRTIFLDEKYDPDSDIKLFLTCKLAEVRRRYALPTSWPPPRKVDKLVRAASGQFIYIATVIRFIQDSNSPDPQALLRAVLDWGPQTSAAHPLAPLDVLYTRIIMSSRDPFMVAKWCGSIRTIGPKSPALYVNQLLQQYEGEARYVLENQASLLFIPPADDEVSPYKFYHRSLLDYFDMVFRCGEDLKSAHRQGSAFLSVCYGRAFKKRAPICSAPGTASQYFLRYFLCGPAAWQYHPLGRRGWSVVLDVSDCDVAWWVHKASSLLSNGDCKELVNAWFKGAHDTCILRSPGDCIPMCKHWRSNLMRICGGLGWKVPDVGVFLREVVLRHGRIYPPGTPDWSRAQHLDSLPFKPPIDGQTSKPPPCEASTTASTRYTVDESYQATLDFVSTAFARLPDTWGDEYRKGMLKGGKTPSESMAPIIESIVVEFGLQIEPDPEA